MSLTHREFSEIRMHLNNGERACDLAKEFCVSQSYISQIKSRKKCTKQIWLTLDEAIEILDEMQMPFTKENTMRRLRLLETRIEQAEVCNERT